MSHAPVEVPPVSVPSQPAATERDHRSGRPWRAILGSVGYVVVAVVAQMVRQSGVSMWRTVWAEDGSIFLTDALHDPLRDTIFRSYAGYGLVLPRILSSIGSVLPPELYAKWAVLSSTGTVALLSLFVYWGSAPVLRAPLRRAILAGSMILLPVLPLEILGAICNIPWLFPIACLFAVLLPVDRPWAIAARLPIVVLGPLSSPLCLALAPIVGVQLIVALVRPRRGIDDGRARRFVIPIAYLVAVLGQLLMYVTASRNPPAVLETSAKIKGLVRLYPTKVITNLVFGVRSTESLWERFGWAVAFVAVALVAGALVWKFVRSDRTARLWLAALVGASVVLYAYSMWSRPEYLVVLVPAAHTYNFLAPRYEVFPEFLLIVALLLPSRLSHGLLTSTRPVVPAPADGAGAETVAAAGPWARFVGGQPWRLLAVVTVIWVGVALVPSFRLTNGRSAGPSWTDGFYAAVDACHDGTVEPVETITISPQPGWMVTYTCAQLTD